MTYELKKTIDQRITPGADRLGQLSGFLADIIATQESPLRSIAALSAVGFVMRDGVVWRDDCGAESK